MPHVIDNWKAEMRRLLKAKYGLSKDKIDATLDKVISKRLKNPGVTVYNNYTNTSVRTTVVDITDTIVDNQLIVTGGGAIFRPHGTRPNILIDFITETMNNRSKAKKERKKYPKGSEEWLQWDIAQLLHKLVINSLYGCMGYHGFTLYNLFTAEAITSEGRHIITTAINALEGFLGDAMYFTTEAECMHFLDTIHREYKDYGDLNVDIFGQDAWLDKAYNRVLSKCKWNITPAQADNIKTILASRDTAELILVLYKNNLLEFSRLPFIASKFEYIMINNGPLSFCDVNLLKDDTIRAMVDEIWKFYQVFVMYDYPINDRLRKAMYIPKSRCLYTDTDSVFISLSHLVEFVRNDILNGIIPDGYDSERDVRFTSVNLSMIFVNSVIDKALKTLCRSTNIEPDWAVRLSMKNEFYLERILFVPKKKRYISLSILQEGQLLKDSSGRIGLPEIKGFDFKKSTTKPYLNEFYTRLATDAILRAPQISPTYIFHEMCELKSAIEEGIHRGETKFFKQSKVKMIENYKNPYRIQGITAVMLWNALVPQSKLELPVDVNIVPINALGMKRFSNKKSALVASSNPLDNPNTAKLAKEHPEIYERLVQEIFFNDNPEIRYMSLTSIALPKNPNIAIPGYIYDLINYKLIVDAAMQLFLPVMNAIGLKSLPTTTTTEHMSNLIAL